MISNNKLLEIYNLSQKASKRLPFEIDLLRPYGIKTLGFI